MVSPLSTLRSATEDGCAGGGLTQGIEPQARRYNDPICGKRAQKAQRFQPLAFSLQPSFCRRWKFRPPPFSPARVQRAGFSVQPEKLPVQADGGRVQRCDSLVQFIGRFVQSSGDAVQAAGRPVQPAGRAVQRSGCVVQRSGCVVQRSGCVVQASNCLELRYLCKNGNFAGYGLVSLEETSAKA